jgi:DNA mismatch repair protein MutL
MPIRVLPDDVANKIAAGEVVERPASVVKELVENALDAEATEIRVELTQGGKRLVRVHDNGIGMNAEDALLCVQRHATSKLTAAEDLATVGTLGFRGEALPSIASVSRMELLTRVAEATEGTRVVVDAGRLAEHGPAGCPVGTRVQVSSLFHNVPARLKFLKADSTELHHALNHVQWAALAFPSVRFLLAHNGRTLLDVSAAQTRPERIRLLYGKEFADQLLAFTRSTADLAVECYIGGPDLTRPNRSYQCFFLNRRPIRDRTVGAALSQALREVIPKDRHAVAFLFLTMPPELVDVNVHPSKAEVRFRDERSVFRALVQAISQGVYDGRLVPEMPLRARPEGTEERSGPRRPESDAYPTAPQRSILPQARLSYGGPHPAAMRPWPGAAAPAARVAPAPPAPAPADRTEVELLDYADAELVGSLFDTFILVADQTDLYFVDQHIASERVLYERIMGQLTGSGVTRQGLLEPHAAELRPGHRPAVEAHRDWLRRFGFDVELFGEGAMLVRAVPAMLRPAGAERTLHDLLDSIATEPDPSRTWEALQEKAAATIACHSAVRAGDRLTPEEQRALLRDLSRTRLPFNCPHGRPILVRMRRAEIETRFHRR